MRTHRWLVRESESSATPRGGRGWSEAGSRSTLERRGAPGRVWLAGWLARGSRCWAEPVQGLSRDRGAHRGTCVGPATGSVSEDVGRAGGLPGWQPFYRCEWGPPHPAKTEGKLMDRAGSSLQCQEPRPPEFFAARPT